MLKLGAPDSGTSTPETSLLDSTIEEVAAAVSWFSENDYLG